MNNEFMNNEYIPVESETNNYETDNTSDVDGARRYASKTVWSNEARQIPLDIVSPLEKELLIKCINKEDLTETELNQLEILLGKYRKGIREIRPEETLQNVEDNRILIEDTNYFLKLVEEQKEVQKITFNYPMESINKVAVFKLEVLPVVDSQSVLDMQENLKLYKDFTQDELRVYDDYRSGRNQTREERALAERVMEKVNEKAFKNQLPIAIEFLARQTRIENTDSSYEDMKKMYENISITYVMLLFKQVEQLTHIGDIDIDNVFRAFD